MRQLEISHLLLILLLLVLVLLHYDAIAIAIAIVEWRMLCMSLHACSMLLCMPALTLRLPHIFLLSLLEGVSTFSSVRLQTDTQNPLPTAFFYTIFNCRNPVSFY